MSVIVDDFGIDTEWVELAAGTTGAASTGAYTIAIMYKPLATSAAVASLLSGSTLTRAISHDSGTLFGENDFSSGFGALVVGDWFIIGQGKDASTATLQWHLYNYTTDGTVSHGAGDTGHGDFSAGDAIRILFAGPPHSWGAVAWLAIWNRNITNAEFASFCTAALSDVDALSPDALIPCNVAALTDLVDVTGNGADYSSHTGANITVGTDPPGYDFSLASPPAEVTLTPAGVTLQGVAVTPTPQPVTVALTSAEVALGAVTLSAVPQPVTVALTPAIVAVAGVALTAVPQPVTVALTPAAVTLAAVALGLASGPAAITLTPAVLTLAAVALAINNQRPAVTRPDTGLVTRPNTGLAARPNTGLVTRP